MERRGDRHVDGPGEHEARPLEMAVDDVELVLPVENGQHRRQEVAHRVVLEVGRPQGDGDRRDEAARHLGITRGEGRDVVAALDQLDDQLVHDALGAAVALGRNALERRGDLGDAQGAVHAGPPWPRV